MGRSLQDFRWDGENTPCHSLPKYLSQADKIFDSMYMEYRDGAALAHTSLHKWLLDSDMDAMYTDRGVRKVEHLPHGSADHLELQSREERVKGQLWCCGGVWQGSIGSITKAWERKRASYIVKNHVRGKSMTSGLARDH